MITQDKDIAKTAHVAEQTVSFAFDEAGPGLSSALRGAFLPGYGFEITRVQHFVRGVSGTVSYMLKVGTTDALASAPAPAAATRATATLHATAANKRGTASSVLNLHLTTSAIAASGTGAAVAGNTGDGTITAAPATGAGAKPGIYRLTCIEPATDAGKFLVQDPDGITIGVATVAVEFTTHLTFTIADGATDFASGDSFTITVAAAGGMEEGVVHVTIRPWPLRGD